MLPWMCGGWLSLVSTSFSTAENSSPLGGLLCLTYPPLTSREGGDVRRDG